MAMANDNEEEAEIWNDVMMAMCWNWNDGNGVNDVI